MPSTLLTSSASSWTSWMVRRPVPHLLRLTLSLSQSLWGTQIGLGSLLPTGRVMPNRIRRRWVFDLSSDALGWQSSLLFNSLNVSQHYPSFKIGLKQQLSECHLRLNLVLPVPHTLESPFSNTQYSYYTACRFKLLFHSHSINVPTEPVGRITFYSHDWWLKRCMCLCSGGDLHYHLSQHGVFSEKEMRFYAAEIILGLEHMHNRFVVYRDLKVQ